MKTPLHYFVFATLSICLVNPIESNAQIVGKSKRQTTTSSSSSSYSGRTTSTTSNRPSSTTRTRSTSSSTSYSSAGTRDQRYDGYMNDRDSYSQDNSTSGSNFVDARVRAAEERREREAERTRQLLKQQEAEAAERRKEMQEQRDRDNMEIESTYERLKQSKQEAEAAAQVSRPNSTEQNALTERIERERYEYYSSLLEADAPPTEGPQQLDLKPQSATDRDGDRSSVQAYDPDKTPTALNSRPGVGPTITSHQLETHPDNSGPGTGAGSNGNVGSGSNGTNANGEEKFFNCNDVVYICNPYDYPDANACVYVESYYVDYGYYPSRSITFAIEEQLAMLRFMYENPQWDSDEFLLKFAARLQTARYALSCLNYNWGRGYYEYEWNFYNKAFERYSSLLPQERLVMIEYETYYAVKALLIDELLPYTKTDQMDARLQIAQTYGKNWGGRQFYDYVLAFNPNDVRLGLKEGMEFNMLLTKNDDYKALESFFVDFTDSNFKQLLTAQAYQDLKDASESRFDDKDHAIYLAANTRYFVKAVLLIEPNNREFLMLQERATSLLNQLDYKGS